MKKFVAFPSIEQFRNVVREVKLNTDYKGKGEDGKAIYRAEGLYPTISFTGTVKIHGCVHADTLITLADGSEQKIKDIKPGTSVLSFNEVTNEIEFDVVNDVIIQELDKPWVELTFDDGSVLKCTADHPILTSVGWVEAKDLEEDHILVHL